MWAWIERALRVAGTHDSMSKEEFAPHLNAFADTNVWIAYLMHRWTGRVSEAEE